MIELIAGIASIIGGVVDKAVPDKDKAAEIKAGINQALINLESEKLKAATNVIVAEANGESWLQRNWRPVLMLWFAGLVGAHWLGYTPENLSDEVVQELLSIVKVGVGGYVIGRSAEKVAREYKK